MRLVLLTALVMCAFAGNSILNRLALADGAMDAMAFGVIRLVAGAVMLGALALGTGRVLPLGDRRRWIEAPALALYVFGFSLAYLRLEAGTGALVLFGGVQVVMFGAAAVAGRPPLRRWLGAAVALAGLALLSGGLGGAALGVPLMLAAALGWGLYSLSGRGAGDPLAATAANFVLAAAAAVLLSPLLAWGGEVTWHGALLAVLSGAVTSGLGYALWYAVLPRLAPEVAGLAQLSVPVIAILGGAILIGEAPSARTLLACAVILAGVALGLLPQRRIGSSGS